MSAVSELAQDPLTYIAATILLHTLTGLVQSLKLKPSKEGYNEHTDRLTSINCALNESIAVTREVAKTVTSIASAQVVSGEITDEAVRELAKVRYLIDSLISMHNDVNSSFSTVKVMAKEEQIMEAVNRLEVAIARLK